MLMHASHGAIESLPLAFQKARIHIDIFFLFLFTCLLPHERAVRCIWLWIAHLQGELLGQHRKNL